jgi:hypothetical protein
VLPSAALSGADAHVGQQPRVLLLGFEDGLGFGMLTRLVLCFADYAYASTVSHSMSVLQNTGRACFSSCAFHPLSCGGLVSQTLQLGQA